MFWSVCFVALCILNGIITYSNGKIIFKAIVEKYECKEQLRIVEIFTVPPPLIGRKPISIYSFHEAHSQQIVPELYLDPQNLVLATHYDSQQFFLVYWFCVLDNHTYIIYNLLQHIQYARTDKKNVLVKLNICCSAQP